LIEAINEQEENKQITTYEQLKEEDMYVIRFARTKFSSHPSIIAGPFVGKGPFVFYVQHLPENRTCLNIVDSKKIRLKLKQVKYSIEITEDIDQYVCITKYKPNTTSLNIENVDINQRFIINNESVQTIFFDRKIEVVKYVQTKSPLPLVEDNLKNDYFPVWETRLTQGLLDELKLAELDNLLFDIQIKLHVEPFYGTRCYTYPVESLINLENTVNVLRNKTEANLLLGDPHFVPTFLRAPDSTFYEDFQKSLTTSHYLFLFDLGKKYLLDDIWQMVIRFLTLTFEEILESATENIQNTKEVVHQKSSVS